MTDEQLLARIRATPWIAEALAGFDFDIARTVNGPVEDVRLAGGEPLEMIAGDASGGAFLLVGDGSGAVVYAGSEGEGGLIATSLRDALALVVGLSSIHDATSMPWGEDGSRLRAWLAEADDEIRADEPALDDHRARLRTALDLPDALDLLQSLHTAATDDRYRPISEHGPYESMLG